MTGKVTEMSGVGRHVQHRAYRTQTPASHVKGKKSELRKRGIIMVSLFV